MKKIIIIFFLLWNTAFSQSRFYLGFTQPFINETNFNATWNAAGPSDTMMLTPQRLAVANAQFTSAAIGHIAIWSRPVTILISSPLKAQILNGTFTGQILSKNASGSAISQARIFLRLINPNGSIASELGNALTTNVPNGTNTQENRQFPPVTLTNVSITAGQRIVVELGWYMNTGSSTGLTWQYYRGNNRATGDLPAGDNTATGLNMWFEFSQKLFFQTNTFF